MTCHYCAKDRPLGPTQAVYPVRYSDRSDVPNGTWWTCQLHGIIRSLVGKRDKSDATYEGWFGHDYSIGVGISSACLRCGYDPDRATEQKHRDARK